MEAHSSVGRGFFGAGMPLLKLTLAYDGTRYAGWQIQKGTAATAGKPTIQETVEKTLQRILQERTRVVGSGRTDAGVHALAQVAHVRIKKRVDTARLLRSLNQLLPPDIAITSVEEAPKHFHARFSAKRKHYRYRIHTGAVVLPFDRPYVGHVRYELNVARMRRELKALVGKHDFRAFGREGSGGRDTVRILYSAQLTRHGDELRIDLVGSGFLHTMVRSIAGTLIDIGRGRLPEGTVNRLLKEKRRDLAGTTAPSGGLILMAVAYG